MKDFIQKILTRVWTIGIPLLLCGSFFVGLFFCMKNIWLWNVWVSAIVTSVLFVLTALGMGKLFRLF